MKQPQETNMFKTLHADSGWCWHWCRTEVLVLGVLDLGSNSINTEFDSLVFDWLVCEVVRAGVNRQNRSSPESYDGVEVLMWSNRNSAEFLCWAWKQQQQPVCNLQQQFVSLKRTLPSSLRSLHHCSETTEEELYRQNGRQTDRHYVWHINCSYICYIL